jgi:hypothetical protein
MRNAAVSVLALFAIVLLFLVPSPGQAQGDSHYFPETKHTVAGALWQYWQAHGGLPQQGYPISDEMQETSDLNGQTYTVQYFERAVFEKHPENQPPYNVLLSQLGTFRYKAKYGAAGAPGQQVSADNPRVFTQTQHTVGGRFRAYWEAHGGLAQQGYPISDEFTETSDLDGKPYRVQYFERAVFELHPENQPPYDVLLSQLGTFQYAQKYVAGHIPSPTPAAPGRLSVAYIVGALKAAGLPIAETQVFTADTDPNHLLGRPHEYVEKATWHDSRLPAPRTPAQLEISDGAGLEIFTDPTDAQKRADYITALYRGLPALAEYDYVHGPVLLRASHQLTPEQAEAYHTALEVIPLGP